MVTVTISTGEGKNEKELCSFDFPETINEVALHRFTEFQTAFERYNTAAKNNDKSGRLRGMLDCVRAFSGQSLEGFPLSEETINTVFANCYRVISQYKRPEITVDSIEFEYKRQTFSVSGVYRDAITGLYRYSDFTAAQVVEALEAWRHYERNRKNDPNGNYLFTSMLYILACFALADGDKFPDTDKSIDRFISNRVTFFKDIPAPAALDVLNFFLTIRKPYKTNRVSLRFGSRRKRFQMPIIWRHLLKRKKKTPVYSSG